VNLNQQAPRLALAILASLLVLYRVGRQVKDASKRGEGMLRFILGISAILAIAGSAWVGVCLATEARPGLLWPGLIFAAVSSLLHVITYGIARARAGGGKELAATPGAVANPSAILTLQDHRMAAFMVLILGASGELGAIRLEAWLLMLGLAILVIAAWVKLIILQFRSE
jgi:hypothetical protein